LVVQLTDEELASNIGRYYYVFEELYPDDEYTVSELASRLGKDVSNTSTILKRLIKRGLLKQRLQERKGRPLKYISLSSDVKGIIRSIVEAMKPVKGAWQPQPDEVKFCLEALETKDTKEMREAFLSDLRSILSSGYWDLQLDVFFNEALGHPDDVEREIMELLNAHPKNSEKIETFFRREKERIYDLVRRPDDISLAAFRVYVDVGEGNEVLDKIEADLEGENAEMVIKAVHGYGWPLYEKFGLDFKKFLFKALKHEKEPVRSLALEIMKTISKSRH